MQLTILQVFPKAREWSGQYGPSCAVRVLFSDGSEGEYVTKPDKAQEHMDRLSTLVGKPNDFEIKATKDWQGTTVHTLSNYPGKPQAQQGGGAGGGRTYTPRYTDTQEGFLAEQTAMNARTALMQAVQMSGFMQGEATPDIIASSEMFFRWLQSKSLSVEAKAPAPAITPTAPVAPVYDAQNAENNGQSTIAKVGNSYLTGMLTHFGKDPQDKGLRRYLAGIALGRVVQACRYLTDDDWDAVMNYYKAMKSPGQQQATIDAYRPAYEEQPA